MAAKRAGIVGVLAGLVVWFAADAGWGACCKCTPCPEPAVACFTTGATEGDCTARCPVAGSGVCSFDAFDGAATCGQGGFADCTLINGQQVSPVPRTPAPVMGVPAVGLTAVMLLVVGLALTTRQVRRDRKRPST